MNNSVAVAGNSGPKVRSDCEIIIEIKSEGDLIDSVKESGLPLVSLIELKDEAERICGKPQKPVFDDRIVAAVKWVDGTIIDVIRKIKTD